MKLYWIRAQAPRRALALAKHLGFQPETVEMDLSIGAMKAPDYRALNPNMKAPTLVDGDRVIWESGAIMAYLCLKAGSDLWPKDDPNALVEIMKWQAWNDCHWMTALDPYYFEHIVKATFGMGPPDDSELAGKDKMVEKYGAVLDDHLKDRDFIVGGRLTVADFYLAPMAAYWRKARMPIGHFANLVRWLDRLDTLPAWADPWPVSKHAVATP